MFTGLIEEVGTIERALRFGDAVRFLIRASLVTSDLRNGDSVCVNGACLTVNESSAGSFEVEAVEETVTKTTLGHLRPGDQVNLERSLRADGRLGGHIVQGHIDGVGEIIGIEERVSSWMFVIRIPENFRRYLVSTGSVAVDGVSLTIAEVKDCDIKISIIPHTYQNTTFGKSKTGEKVNVEVDLIGKYVEKLLDAESPVPQEKSEITVERLKQLGY
jgi:riboflavin synthase